MRLASKIQKALKTNKKKRKQKTKFAKFHGTNCSLKVDGKSINLLNVRLREAGIAASKVGEELRRFGQAGRNMAEAMRRFRFPESYSLGRGTLYMDGAFVSEAEGVSATLHPELPGDSLTGNERLNLDVYEEEFLMRSAEATANSVDDMLFNGNFPIPPEPVSFWREPITPKLLKTSFCNKCFYHEEETIICREGGNCLIATSEKRCIHFLPLRKEKQKSQIRVIRF